MRIELFYRMDFPGFFDRCLRCMLCPVKSTLQTARTDARELLLMSKMVRTLTGRGEGLAPGPQGVEHRLVLVPGEQDRRVRLRGAVVAASAVRPSGRGVSGRHPHEIRSGVGGVRPGADSEVPCSWEIHLILVIRVMWHFSELTVTH